MSEAWWRTVSLQPLLEAHGTRCARACSTSRRRRIPQGVIISRRLSATEDLQQFLPSVRQFRYFRGNSWRRWTNLSWPGTAPTRPRRTLATDAGPGAALRPTVHAAATTTSSRRSRATSATAPTSTAPASSADWPAIARGSWPDRSALYKSAST